MLQQLLKAFLGWKNLNLKLKPETCEAVKAALDAELHIRNKWMIPTAAANVQHVFSTWLMWPWRVKMPIQNLLGLLLLLMFVMWIMLATVCCRFGDQGLIIKLKRFWVEVRQDFEVGLWLPFCRWYFVEVMKFYVGRNTEARFWSIFWIVSLV